MLPLVVSATMPTVVLLAMIRAMTSVRTENDEPAMIVALRVVCTTDTNLQAVDYKRPPKQQP